MDASRGHREIIEHIKSVSARAQSHAAAPASIVALGRCWPGGTADRTEPSALAWVRGWGPRAAGVARPACTCAEGRCRVCN
jgi:hypothetical protein